MSFDFNFEKLQFDYSVLAQMILERGLKIVWIIVLALVGLYLAKKATNKILSKVFSSDEREALARKQTLGGLLLLIMRIVVFFVATMLILREFGIDLRPILATAGVVGLAVGFGAQELVKDIIGGFFILLDDQIRVGDVVSVDGKSGVVEKFGLRTVVLRDLSGNLHFIRNGGINVATNMSKDFSCYVFNLGVSYDTDIEKVYEVLKAVDEEMRQDPAFSDKILAPIEIFGLDEMADSALIVKARTKTQPLEQWGVGREFLLRIKKAFDGNGIEIPFPHRTLYLRDER